MALDDRGLPGEKYVELTCETENISPYCNNTAFTEPSNYYHSGYEWQHAQIPQHQTHLLESDKHFYPGYAEESDVSTHGYSTYGHQPVNHSDFYPQAHGLWPVDNPSEALPTGQLNQHHLFFSGLDLGQQSVIQQTNATSSTSMKPKRKRVQSHTQRKAANVRERRRMYHLNEAFDELRKRLPAFNYEKRLSRIETLRLAMTYISFMKEVSVGRDPKCVKLKPHGADLSPLPHSSGSLLTSPHPSYVSSDNNDECNVNEDSDYSNDELSNHSGGQ